MNLNYLKEFFIVCETRSFTAAAYRLGISRSVLSEHMNELEKQLELQLLKRTTRQVVPTAVGEEIRRVGHNAFEQIDQILLNLQHQQRGLKGLIRLTCPADFSATLLSSLIAHFHKKHPQVTFDVIASDESLDLITHNLDLSIRTGWLVDSSYHATSISSFKQLLVAAPALANTFNGLCSPADLVHYPWLRLTVLKSRLWVFRHLDGQEVSVRLEGLCSANSASVIYNWVKQGVGVTVLPDYQVHQELQQGQLIHLLPEWQLPEGGIYAVYPDTSYLPYRVRVFIDFLKDSLQNKGNLVIQPPIMPFQTKGFSSS